MNKNIIIALCSAFVITLLCFIGRDTIGCYFVPVKEEETSVSGNGTSGRDLFDSFAGDENADLGEGNYSYKALADRYASLKSLYLKVENSTEVYQDGKLMDSSKDTQIFRYKSRFRLSVVSSENELYCDGKNVTRYIPKAKTYMTEKMSEDFFSALVTSSPALNTIGLLTGTDYSGRIKNYEHIGDENINGKNCYVIKITLDGQGQVPDFIQKLWIEEKEGIIIKNYYEISRSIPEGEGGKLQTIVMKVTNLTSEYAFDGDMPDRYFAFAPKKGDEKYDPAKEAEFMAQQAELEQQMLNEKLAEPETVPQTPPAKEENPVPEPPKTQKEKAREEAVREMMKNDPVNKQIYNFRASGFSPNAYRGQKLIILFWAYGMGESCMADAENFARACQDKYKVVTVNVNADSKLLKEQVDKDRYSVPVYYLDEKTSKDISKKLGLYVLPAYYFVDEIGVVRATLFGNASKELLEQTAYEKLDLPSLETPGEEKEENKDL